MKLYSCDIFVREKRIRPRVRCPAPLSLRAHSDRLRLFPSRFARSFVRDATRQRQQPEQQKQKLSTAETAIYTRSAKSMAKGTSEVTATHSIYVHAGDCHRDSKRSFYVLFPHRSVCLSIVSRYSKPRQSFEK